MRRALTSLVAAGAATVLLAGPALATVYDRGTENCASNQTGRSVSDTTGFTRHYPPDTGYQQFRNGNDRRTQKWLANNNGGGNWVVTTEGAMWDNGTYADCVTTGTTRPQG